MTGEDFSVWLFGSCARGDSDDRSDYDVLVVGEQCPVVPPKLLVDISGGEEGRISMSHYEWDQIDKMASYGSLFLHHVSREGKILWEGARVHGRLRKILDSLPTYTRIQQDVLSYRKAVSDVRSSLLSGGYVPFELSVLATTLRHAAVLGCYVIGNPNFGRISAVEVYARCSALGEWGPTRVRALLDYKLWSEGRLAFPKHDIDEHGAAFLCDGVDILIDRVEGDARWRGYIAA